MSLTPFAYVNAEKSSLYRAVMTAFVEAKQRFLVHLRPEDVLEHLAKITPESLPSPDEAQSALDQLVNWGNLQANPDTGRVTTVEDFYRARYLYQLTREGEAAEIALAAYDEALGKRGALQAVALQDIRVQLRALQALAEEASPDPARAHHVLRDLSRVFADLAENAQSFMTGLGRTLDLRGVNRDAFIAYKERLIDYLERFIGDLVTASADIARLIQTLSRLPTPDSAHSYPGEALDRLLTLAARREALDTAPGPEFGDEIDELDEAERIQQHLKQWQARWQGLQGWFIGSRQHPSQASLLRNRARKAISELLEAMARLNERRLGRSDRSADFRTLARWFAECDSDLEAHRLWRAAFGLAPARHLTLDEDTLAEREHNPVPANTAWLRSPPIHISPRLRATGSFQKRGLPPKIPRHDKERAWLARQLADESAQTRAARARLATGEETRLSTLGELDRDSFALFLQLLGDALSGARKKDEAVSVTTGDGTLRIDLEPLEENSQAAIHTPDGVFRGRDYRLRITDLERAAAPRPVAPEPIEA